MKNWILCIIAGLLTSCAPGILPPELCAPIGDESLFIEEEKEVQICFLDPDGGDITLSVNSSSPSVVSAQARDESVILKGISVGEAVITITATDPDGDISEETFSVEVPNREPELIRELAPMILTEDDGPVGVSLIRLFTDPDGHQMTFTIENSNPTAVSTSLRGTELTVEFIALGESEITITATDKFSGVAEGELNIRATERTLIFRDDFDALSSRWTPDEDTETEIKDGALKISVNKPIPFHAFIPRTVRTDKWKTSMRLRNITDDMWGGIMLFTSSEEIPEIYFLLGANAEKGFLDEEGKTNFGYMLSGTNFWIETDASNYAEVLNDGMSDQTLTVTAGRRGYTVEVDGKEIIQISRDTPLPTDLTQLALVSWPAGIPPLNPRGGSWIDWIEVYGVNAN